jgi:DNA-binding Lrp family transcriptional regulator
MSTKAYVLIESAVGKTRDIVNRLAKVDGITLVDMVTGPYDIIAVVESDDLNSVGELITSQVHVVGGIVRTVTCLAVST